MNEIAIALSSILGHLAMVDEQKPKVRMTEAQRKKKIAQAKDIPDEVMIDLVSSLQNIQRAYVDGRGLQYFKTSSASRFDIQNLWPSVPEKVILAKLRRLINRDVIDGCACGCRGDFRVLTTEEPTYLSLLVEKYVQIPTGKG